MKMPKTIIMYMSWLKIMLNQKKMNPFLKKEKKVKTVKIYLEIKIKKIKKMLENQTDQIYIHVCFYVFILFIYKFIYILYVYLYMFYVCFIFF